MPHYRIAPLTAVIVLLTSGAQQLVLLESAFYRVVEITLGSFVGLGVSLVLLPARAHGLVTGAAARMLGHLADLLSDWLAVLAGCGDRTRTMQLQDDIRADMARLEIVAGEAHRERRTYLTHEFDPNPLVRRVFRLRNDVVMIGRAAAERLARQLGLDGLAGVLRMAGCVGFERRRAGNYASKCHLLGPWIPASWIEKAIRHVRQRSSYAPTSVGRSPRADTRKI